MLLILAPVFCPRLAEEEFRGVKQKNMTGGILYFKNTQLRILMIKEKERVRPFHPFRQKTHAQIPKL